MYGIYTAADQNYFAGVVASINSMRFHGYRGPMAVMDTGLEPWMRDYLAGYDGVTLLSLDLLRRSTRFTDVRSDESPVSRGNSFKWFGAPIRGRFLTHDSAEKSPLSVIRPAFLIAPGTVISCKTGVLQQNRHMTILSVVKKRTRTPARRLA